jgi:zinc protease
MEERKQTVDNDPRSLFWEQLRATLYNTSPYSIPIIGWRDEMKHISWDLARNYYERWYAPNNSILVVSGDVTKDELKPLAEKYYGILPIKKIPDHHRPNVPDFSSSQHLYFKDKSVQQPLWVKVRLVPSQSQDYETALALQIVQEILSGGASTILYQEFVVKQKKAIEVELSYDGDQRGQGSLWLYATPAKGIALKELQNDIEEFLNIWIKNPISETEIINAKTRLIDQSLYARDSVAGPAMVIGQGLASGLTLDQIETWPNTIKNISSDRINKVTKLYLDTTQSNWITGYMESAP